MLWICVECNAVATPAATDAADGGAAGSRPTCATCSTELDEPTVFDCARLGLVPELQELIAKDPAFDVNAREPSSNATLLHHAAINIKMRTIEYIVATFRESLHVDALGGEQQTTPLCWAAHHNRIYAVELLLRHGANPHFVDRAGYTPFLLAIQKCFPILAAYLVAKGSPIDSHVADAHECTALMILCQRQHFHLDSFRMVLSLGASVDAKDADGNTALHHAVANNLGLAVRMLLDVGATTTLVNAKGKTPLEIARGSLDDASIARHLLEGDAHLRWLAQRTSLSHHWLEKHLHKLSFVVPWGFLPGVAWILSNAHGALAIIIQLSLLVGAAFVVLKQCNKGAYGDKRKAAALLFGVNVASIFWLVVAFPILAARVHLSMVVQLLLAISVIGMLVCLYLTTTVDSGTVFTTHDEKIHNIQELVESKSPSATKLCLTCLHRRPIRAKHCAELNACIAKFDHYCPFVVNAVGAENHHYFLGFLAFAVVSISFELYVGAQYLSTEPVLAMNMDTGLEVPTTTASAVVWGHGLGVWLWSVVHYEPLACCVLALAALHVAWIGYLLVFHVYLMAAALTTNEVVKHENLDRVYSRGVVRNVLDFLRLGGGARVDWRRLYRLEHFQAALLAYDTKPKAY